MINSRRREERIAVRLTIRVWGMDANGKPFSQNTSTLDVTRNGARLGTLQCQLQQGDVIGIQHGTEKARFKVAWVGRPGTARQGQVGVVCVESDKYIWGQPLSSLKAKAAPTPSAVAPATHDFTVAQPQTAPKESERRDSTRYACTGGAEFRNMKGGFKNWGTVSDVSENGCYIETIFPLPAQSQVEVLISVRNVEIRGRAVVRSSHPNVGMGIEFNQLSAEDHQRLNNLISMLAIIPAAAHSAAPAQELHATLGPKNPPPIPPSPAPSPAKRPSVSDSLYQVCTTLKDAEAILETSAQQIEPRAVSELLRAIDHARNAVVALQHSMESRGGPDQYMFLSEREAARVRTVTVLARELTVDIDASLLTLGSEGLEGLLNAVSMLHKKLTKLVESDHRRNAHSMIPPS